MYLFFSWGAYAATINMSKRDLTLILQNFYRCYRPSNSFSFYFVFSWEEVGSIFVNLVDLYGGSSGPKLCVGLVYRAEHLCFLTARRALQAGLYPRWHLSASCVWVVFSLLILCRLSYFQQSEGKKQGRSYTFSSASWLAWWCYEGE